MLEALIIGAIGAGIGFVAGVIGARESNAYDAKQRCGCGHHRCFHDEDGKCRHNDVGYRCGCQRYIGPITVDEIIADGG